MNESNSPLDTITIDDRSFIRLDDTPDEFFYQTPRFVTHIDDPACAALTDYYATHLQNGDRILDLMSSCVSPPSSRSLPENSHWTRDERGGIERQPSA